MVWASLRGSDLASFDRRECSGPLNGPAATGDDCPEGWEFCQFPGPGFGGLPDNNVESGYYIWVDRGYTLGPGENVPIAAGNLFDGFHALTYGRYVTLRVPYPMGFYAMGLGGPIDDPSADRGAEGAGPRMATGRPSRWRAARARSRLQCRSRRDQIPRPTGPQATSSSRLGDRR